MFRSIAKNEKGIVVSRILHQRLLPERYIDDAEEP